MRASQLASAVKRLVPVSTKDAVKRALGRGPERPAVQGVATTLDLYVWLAGDDLDTLVPIHNWYSVLFPQVDTATSATVEVLDQDGRALTTTSVEVPPLATPTLSVSSLLADAGRPPGDELRCGSLVWHLAPPAAVRDLVLGDNERFVFWDRSYIGYAGPADHVAWVHGVDKLEVVDERGERTPWPIPDEGFACSPEMPVDLSACRSMELLVQNRDARERRITLEVGDAGGRTVSLDRVLPPRGVHRFVLDAGTLAGLETTDILRLRVSGQPTRYGRPIAFRRFENGTFSLMHC